MRPICIPGHFLFDEQLTKWRGELFPIRAPRPNHAQRRTPMPDGLGRLGIRVTRLSPMTAIN